MKTTSYAHLILFAVFLLFLSSCASSKTIVNGISERDANEILVLLNGKGIEATKLQSAQSVSTGSTHLILYDVQVPNDQAIQAMDILDQAGLPRPQNPNLLELFANTGLVPSAEQEKIRYQAGLAQQIANTIRKIDGIIDASVIISFPKENPLEPEAKKNPITASVFVKHNGVLDDPNSHLIQKIKQLVSSSVTGLSYDNVTVVPERAALTETSEPVMSNLNQNKLVDVWSILISQNSVDRFQAIFFGLIIFSLLCLLGLLWVLFKVFPLLKEKGGFKKLLELKSIDHPHDKVEKAKIEPVREEKPKEKGDDEGNVT